MSTANAKVINVEEVMQRIRSEVKEASSKGRSNLPRYTPANEFKQDDGTALIDYDELNFINAHWQDWSTIEDLSSHRKLLGPFIVKAKKFIVDLVMNTCLRGYFDRERQFHLNLVRYLNANARYVDNRDYKNFWQLVKKVDSDVSALNERMDRLYDQLSSTVLSLQEEIAELKKQSNTK